MPSIATATRVERDALLEFLRPLHHAILPTTRRDGRPQGSSVACGIDTAQVPDVRRWQRKGPDDLVSKKGAFALALASGVGAVKLVGSYVAQFLVVLGGLLQAILLVRRRRSAGQT